MPVTWLAEDEWIESELRGALKLSDRVSKIPWGQHALWAICKDKGGGWGG